VGTAPAGEVAAVVEAGGAHVAPLLGAVEERLTAVAASHGPALAGHAVATIEAGGKRLRPLVVLLAAGPAAEDDRHREPLVRAAAAVELVHSATLVHDDVLDDAPLRRGRPTVYAQAGRAAATQTGDLLFARAFAELAATGDAEQVRVLSDAGSALARGELLQRADSWDAGIPLERYLKRCDLKTARLFRAAAQLGALVAGEEAATVAALGDFGKRIGLAFQVLDDVLDVQGPAERTGKHRGTDLLDGTVTLPFILARERDPDLGALDPRAITTPEQAEAICDRRAGRRARARARARRAGQGRSPGDARRAPPRRAGAGGRRRRREVRVTALTWRRPALRAQGARPSL
jgi:geranylgeranyl pyrophosphate synthase